MQSKRDVLAGGLAFAMSALCPATLLAEELTFGAYEEFTLYNAESGSLKDEVLFLFHGFASAMPNGAYKALFKEFSERYSVIGFNYDYFDLARDDEVMDLVWEKVLEGRQVTFGGTSLGGFMANYYAEKYGVARVVLVNPVTDPTVQLRQFIGRVVVEKRSEEIEVTQKELDRYLDRVGDALPGLNRLVILTRDDEILDYRLAELKFGGPGNKVVLLDEGGHSPDLGQPHLADALRGFLLSPSE